MQKVLGRDIVKAVAERHGIEPAVLISRKRTKPVAAARLDAINLMRAEGFTSAKIGRVLGRDPSTIRYQGDLAYRAKKRKLMRDHKRARRESSL